MLGGFRFVVGLFFSQWVMNSWHIVWNRRLSMVVPGNKKRFHEVMEAGVFLVVA